MGADILLIKLGAVGDVLRTTSVLYGLKEKYPDSRITWLTKENALELLQNNELINKAVTIEHYEKNRRLLASKYEYVINLDEDEEACKIASSVQGTIIGFYWSNNKVCPTDTAKEWYNMGLLGQRPQNDILKKENTKTYQEHMLDILGLKTKNHEMILNLTGEELSYARHFADSYGIKDDDFVVGLNTGSGKRWEKKRWDELKTATLAERLSKEMEAKVILLGGPEEKERNERIKEMVDFDMIDSGTENSMRHFAAIINLCDTVVTSDSLAMHMAIALKKETIVLFGPTSSAEIELYRRGKKIVPDMECVCCYKRQCDKEPSCTDKITVDEVFEAVKHINKTYK